MKNISFIFILITLCGFCPKNNSVEDYDGKCRRLVLKGKEINKEYHFLKNDANHIYKYKITYIGSIKTQKRKLYFIKEISHLGWNQDSENCYIYTDNGDEIGNYHVGDGDELRITVKSPYLLFCYNNTAHSCQRKTTKVNFADNIPSEIFIPCNNGLGDVYTFAKYEDYSK